MISFFDTLDVMRGYQGDKFPTFMINLDEPMEGASMHVDLEYKYEPGVIVKTFNCGSVGDSGGIRAFTLTLDSDDTVDLLGVYLMHFVMEDQDGSSYKKLDGILEVLPYPEVST